jgi:hypothetical protein
MKKPSRSSVIGRISVPAESAFDPMWQTFISLYQTSPKCGHPNKQERIGIREI